MSSGSNLTKFLSIAASPGPKIVTTHPNLRIQAQHGRAEVDYPDILRSSADSRALRIALEKSDVVAFDNLKHFLERVSFSKRSLPWSKGWMDAAVLGPLITGEKTKMKPTEAARSYDALGENTKWLYQNVIGPAQSCYVNMQRRKVLYDWVPSRVYYSTDSAIAGRVSTPVRDGSLNIHSMPASERHKLRVFGRDRCFVSADYIAQEYSIIAAVSGCPRMTAVAERGVDPHCFNARVILKASAEEEGTLRDAAKTLFFVLVYGGGANALANSLSVSHAEASSLIRALEQTYPDFVEWREAQIEKAKREGLVTSPLGRRLKVDPEDEWNIKKMVVNFPMQSIGADMNTAAVLSLHDRLPSDCWAIIAHHDAIVVDCPTKAEAEVAVALQECMCEHRNKVVARLNSKVTFRTAISPSSVGWA